jgi:ribonuclease P protein component
MRFVPSGETPRVAIATSRGTGNAVTRNRVRRRLRAAVAAHRDELRPGAYLFGSGRQAATAPLGALRDAVGELLRTVPEASP